MWGHCFQIRIASILILIGLVSVVLAIVKYGNDQRELAKRPLEWKMFSRAMLDKHLKREKTVGIEIYERAGIYEVAQLYFERCE